MTDLPATRTFINDRQRDRLSWGVVELQVTDLERAVAFWTTALGLVQRDHAASGAALGTYDRTLFVLRSGATRPVAAAHTGMYHVAIGVPSQAEFSRIFARLIQLNVPVSPTDHLLAKSLYIADPDGLDIADPDGLEIEINFETPERFGRFDNSSKGFSMYDVDGNPHNGREPLDVATELAHAKEADLMAPLDDDTYIAHVHFKVANLRNASDWFETLGFKRHLTLENWGFADMDAGMPNTHRLAMNIWAGSNRPKAPDDMARLVGYELIAHDRKVFAGSPLQKDGDVLRGTDLAGVEVTLRAATRQ